MDPMNRRVFGVLAATALVAGSLWSAASLAQDRTGWPSSIKVGTASQGGTFFIYGSGWAGLVQEKLGIQASSEVTGGPVQNMALVQTNDVQFAMTTMGPAYEAWTGNSPIVPGVEFKDVRATFPMYQTPFEVVALKSSGISSVADLEGKTVGVGPRGGTPGTVWPEIFETLGVNVNLQFGGASDLVGQVKDGLIDAFAFAAGLPIAAFSELEAQAEVNIFSFTPEEQAKIVESFASLSAFEMPAGIYRSTPEPRPSVAMWNFGIVHKDMPESLVYEVMKVVLDNHDRMMQIHGAAAETLPENYDKNNFLWFHPGAIRYFKEKGFELSEDVIPPEYQG
jgi:TRAP transporter TAXI family solute receptor